MPATRHARRTFGRASDVALLRGFRDRNPARSISASASAHGCRVARSANWDSHRVVADNLIHPRASSWGSSHKNERAICQENDVTIPYFQPARLGSYQSRPGWRFDWGVAIPSRVVKGIASPQLTSKPGRNPAPPQPPPRLERRTQLHIFLASRDRICRSYDQGPRRNRAAW